MNSETEQVTQETQKTPKKADSPKGRLRFIRSGYILTAIAAAWMSGVLLLHFTYVKPNLARQAERIETDTGREWLRLTNDFLRARRTQMQRLTSNWALTANVAGYFQIRDRALLDESLPAESLSRNRIAAVLLCDRQQRLISAWKAGPDGRLQADSGYQSGQDLSEATFFQLGAGADEMSGLDLSPAGPAIFARSSVRRTDDGQPLGYVISLRPMDQVLYAELSAMVGVNVTLAEQADPPGGLAEGQQAVWRGAGHTLHGVQTLHDSAGRAMGYLTVEGQAESTYRQIRSVEQALTGTVIWAAAFALAMVLVIHVVVSGPTAKLLSRVRRLRKGEPVQSLSESLRGEALALARQFEEVLAHVEKLGQTDTLTGLPNRRSFQQTFTQSFRQARRYSRSMTLVMMDLDFFKAANDALGHQTGDQMLKIFADTIVACVRTTDTVTRLGGDEFAVLMHETTAADAEVVAERIRELLATRSIGKGELQMTLTASIGIADINDPAVQSPETLMDQADKALYAAKQTGRNRVVRSDHMPDPESLGTLQDQTRVDRLCKQLAGLDAKFKRVFVDAIGGLISALEARDEHTANHSAKVRRYAMMIARKMGMSERAVEHVGRAAMLHDIGKIGLPDSVLLKDSSLTEQEWQLVKRHPIMSVRIVEGMDFLEQEIPAVRYHHERFDGSGYPEGLSGSAIPLPARILAVADAFDAMVSSRVYRSGMGVEAALAELARGNGTQFDPAVVEAFMQLVKDQNITDASIAAQAPVNFRKLSA